MLHVFYKDYALLRSVISEASPKYKCHIVRLNLHPAIRVLRKVLGRNICYFHFLSWKIFVPSVYDAIKQVKQGDHVLLLEMILPSEVWSMSRLLPNDCDLYLWYWNPLHKTYPEKEILSNVLFTKMLGFKLFTFDDKDAKDYSLQYHNQFSIRLHFEERLAIKFDFFFLGRTKDRHTEVEEIKNVLRSYGYRLKFLELSDIDTYIPYEKNIRYVLESKCVVDIVQKRQCGMTMRPIEALLYKKKLLTNNVNISKYDFYSSNNVFIYGRDSIGDLARFLSIPYEEIDEGIVNKYTVSGWLKAFE